ncbi:MAG: MBL fold metallo-hydrolase [Candidatus Brocadiae bacterium]|nr:MBL fold metallo-hydrolase [Candidatus Brocadiia bacterium]
MGAFIKPNIYMSERTVAIEGKQAITLIEPGYDVVVSGKYQGSSVADILDWSQSIQKPVRYIAFSHAHGDHVGNLPFYLKRLQEKPFLLGHANSPIFTRLEQSDLVNAKNFIKISQDRQIEVLDNLEYHFLSTPGHNNAMDDISVFFPEQKILFLGDLYQPQGSSYEKSDGLSPVPFFYDGNAYLASLKRLMEIKIEMAITGHGEILDEKNAYNGLMVTSRCIHRIQQLSEHYVKMYPKEGSEILCEWVYNSIVKERNYDERRALARKQKNDVHGRCDYEVYDRPGILYFIMNFLSR